MLIGKHHHTMDGKGRLVFPQRFRATLGERFIVTRGLGGCLWAFSLTAWQTLSENIKTASLADGLSLRRFFFAHAEEVEPDVQGRILISQTLRKLGRLEREIVLVGSDTYAEIWDADAWEELSDKESEEELLELIRKSGL